MTWFRDVANCLGLSGSISILQQFFGYSERISKAYEKTDPRYPGSISLLDQMKLLKNGLHILIHIKILDPQWKRISIDRRIYAMRQLYGKNGIGVVVRSTEKLNIPLDSRDIDVDGCSHGDPSDAQVELYNNNTNSVMYVTDPSGEFTFTREIVLFFVRTIYNPVAGGCASSYNTVPCAVISKNSPRYVLAHESGHLLGLEHPDEDGDSDPQLCIPDRLMTDCDISSNPFLIDSEVQTMKSSSLMFHC